MTKKSVVVLGIVVLALGVWLGTALADRSASAPPMVYSGQILMGGVPVSDTMPHMVRLELFDSPTAATGILCDNGVVSVTTTNGHFSLPLDPSRSPPCDDVFQSAETVYVDLTVDGTHLTTRAQASAVPFAVAAERVVLRPRTGGTAAITGSGLYCNASTPTNGAVRSGGTLTSWAAAVAECRTACSSPTAHVCSIEEMGASAQLGVAVPASVWVHGPSTWTNTTDTESTTDCQAWRSASGVDWGHTWSGAGREFAEIDRCTTVSPIACCD